MTKDIGQMMLEPINHDESHLNLYTGLFILVAAYVKSGAPKQNISSIQKLSREAQMMRDLLVLSGNPDPGPVWANATAEQLKIFKEHLATLRAFGTRVLNS